MTLISDVNIEDKIKTRQRELHSIRKRTQKIPEHVFLAQSGKVTEMNDRLEYRLLKAKEEYELKILNTNEYRLRQLDVTLEIMRGLLAILTLKIDA